MTTLQNFNKYFRIVPNRLTEKTKKELLKLANEKDAFVDISYKISFFKNPKWAPNMLFFLLLVCFGGGGRLYFYLIFSASSLPTIEPGAIPIPPNLTPQNTLSLIDLTIAVFLFPIPIIPLHL